VASTAATLEIIISSTATGTSPTGAPTSSSKEVEESSSSYNTKNKKGNNMRKVSLPNKKASA
jgi:hypothetical protein